MFDDWNKHLCHHGIKGQEWGVRRGPPYPIEDTTLKKGTRINTVQANPNTKRMLENTSKNKKWLYVYNPEDAWDSKVYKGPFSYFKLKQMGMMMTEHSLEVVEDLKMPTKKERIDNFIDMYNQDIKTVSKEIGNFKKLLDQYGVDQDRTKGLDLSKKLSTKEDFEKAYAVFNHMMENVDRFKSTKRYSEIMSKKYDAMVDDNNQGVYNETHDPIIIFRANNVLKEAAPARTINIQELAQNYYEVAGELAKKGKHVLL